MHDPKQIIIAALNTFVRQKYKTLTEAAQVAGVGRTRLSEVLNNKRNPSYELAVKYLHKFGGLITDKGKIIFKNQNQNQSNG